MSRFKRSKNKSNEKSSISINEKISLLNKELKKTGMLSEVMNTSNVYSTSTFVPPKDAIDFFVPDTTGVTGDGFTPPVSGDPDDPSNWPDAYTNTDWMFNPNEIDGETNRPIPASVDPAVIAAYNAAFPDDGRFPAGGGGIVFGDVAFGTAVGYNKGGHFYQVLNPGLFGNGSTKTVPPDAPFGAPWFGLFGMYFPATPELAGVIKAMSKAYAEAGGYNPQGAMPIDLWRDHNSFHDGSYDNFSGKKYTDGETGRRYVLQRFFMHRAGNVYKQDPSAPRGTTNPIIRGTEDEPIYPGPIPPGGLFPPLSDPAYDFLRGRAQGNTGKGKGDKGDKDTRFDRNDNPFDDDKNELSEEDKQRLLANARRIDARNQRLADDMTAKDPRNQNAALVLTIGGTYIVAKSLYAAMAAAILAGYSLYELQKLQSDFEADFQNTIIWRSNDGTAADTRQEPFESEAERAEKDAAFDKAQQDARAKDQEAARQAAAEVERARQELENAQNETQEAIAAQRLADAEKRYQAQLKQNTANKAARRRAKDRRGRTTGKQGTGYTGPETFNPDNLGMFSNSFKPQGKVLSEGVGLGHFEPEQLNVDIEDLRKGIMPEYPEKPPAEMIDGYHKNSRLKPKEFKDKYQLKLDKKVLLRNHRLKKKEIDEMVKTVNMINEYLKKNPGDLIYAQQRYPVDDQRLAVLNWKMDQMLDAGKEYLDSNFKENKTLFDRVKSGTLKNMKLTDPDYIQSKYDELRGTPKSKGRINKMSPSRFFKKTKRKTSMDEINDKIKKLDKDLLI